MSKVSPLGKTRGALGQNAYSLGKKEFLDVEKGLQAEARHLRHKASRVWWHPSHLKQMILYWIETHATGTFFSKVALFVFSGGGVLVVMAEAWLGLCRLLLRREFSRLTKVRHRSEAYWIVFNGLADPGNVGDMGAARGATTTVGKYVLRSFAGVIALSGVIYLSVLMGFLVEAISSMMNRSAKGLSPLVEEDHILVVGFTDKCLEVLDGAGKGCEGGQLQTAPISVVFHSFRLMFGRAIISRNGLEAWVLFPERARAEHPR